VSAISGSGSASSSENADLYCLTFYKLREKKHPINKQMADVVKSISL